MLRLHTYTYDQFSELLRSFCHLSNVFNINHFSEVKHTFWSMTIYSMCNDSFVSITRTLINGS